MPMQGDTWWQLRAGKDMWATRSVLSVDTYSFTVPGAPWPNHEWLAEVLFYLAYRTGGLGLLNLLATGLISAGWLITWRLTRAPVDIKFAATIAALISAAVWWEPRPHAFSLLFIPLSIFLLTRNQWRWIPPIFLIWANCHGGVLLGLVLVAAAAAAEVVVEPTRLRSRIVLVVLCMLAMTSTPMGFHFWTEIPLSLTRISQYTFDEWRRPGLTEIPLLPFWGIAAVLLALVAWNRSRLIRLSPSQAAICSAALVLLAGAVTSIRHVSPFLMLALPAISVFVPEASMKRMRETNHQRWANLSFLAAAFIGVGVIVGLAYKQEWPRLRWQPVPAAALAAIDACPGNLYHRYDEGGYLLWFLPGRPVFLDGRQDPYPAEMVLAHIEMETGKGVTPDVLVRYDIGCAFLPVSSPTVGVLSRAGWHTLYRDTRWAVFKRPPS